MKKIVWVLGAIVTAVLLFLAINWYQNRQNLNDMIARSSEVPKWTADTRALVTKKNFEQNSISRVKADGQKIDPANVSSIVIPGLRGAWSVNHQTKQASFGTNWVPQGVTESGNQYFISLYDGDHKRDSIIVIIHKKSRTYEKTLILGSKSHVGGITYDQERQRLWWADDHKKDAAGIAYTSQATIDSYDARKVKGAIAFTRISIPWYTRTSTIQYYKNQLIVGIYRPGKPGPLMVMPTDQTTGLPDARISTVVDGVDLTSRKQLVKRLLAENVLSKISIDDPNTQGVAVTGKSGLTLISSSEGIENSMIQVKQPNQKSGTGFRLDKETVGDHTITMPPSIEQISVYSDHLSAIFESGAKKYREVDALFGRPIITDRIMILKIQDVQPKKPATIKVVG